MEKSKKKKIIKIIAGVVILGIVTAVIIVVSIFMTPHRDVKNTATDFKVNAKVLVDEYIADASSANQKYLSDDGDSKIFEVTGRVDQMFKNQKNQDVILLKPAEDELGVQCTFITGESIDGIAVDNTITIKGKIEQGASYDEDLEIGEDVIIGEGSLIK